MAKTTPSPIARPRHQPGFTLIELMVTVSVLAVLVAIAVPSMAGLMRQWALNASAETFAADLRLARSTATRLSRPVTVCPHEGQIACTQGNRWEAGWMVFVDLDNDKRLDMDETVVVRRGPQAGIASLSIKGDSGDGFKFRSNGTLASAAGTATVVAGAKQQDQRSIAVNRMGRVHVDITR